MPGKGRYYVLDLKNVRASARNTEEFLKHTLPKLPKRRLTVVFLGEEHGNNVDTSVTQGLLSRPPLVKPNMRVVFERGLENVYGTAAVFETVRTEPVDLRLSRQARSAKIAEMVLDAFNNDIDLVYVVCGSAHAKEIFDYMNKKATQDFMFIFKPSSTD